MRTLLKTVTLTLLLTQSLALESSNISQTKKIGSLKRALKFLGMLYLGASKDCLATRYIVLKTESQKSLRARSSLSLENNSAQELDLFQVKEGTLEELKADPSLVVLEEDVIDSSDWSAVEILLNPNITEQWALGSKGFNVSAAWDCGYRGSGVAVGVCDSGRIAEHEDLIFNGDCESFRSGESNCDATGYHGTHVEGTICAIKDNEKGVAGVAPGATCYAARVVDDSGFGARSQILEGIQHLVNKGIRIINLSISGAGSCDESSSYRALFEAAPKDVLFVVSAGNSGYSTLSSRVPSSCYFLPNVVTVTSIDSSGKISSFSNIEETNQTKIIAAPGRNILAPFGPEVNDYKKGTGTSMATSNLAGGVAIIWGALLDSGKNVTAAEVKEILFEKFTRLSSYDETRGNEVPIFDLSSFSQFLRAILPPSPSPSTSPTMNTTNSAFSHKIPIVVLLLVFIGMQNPS